MCCVELFVVACGILRVVDWCGRCVLFVCVGVLVFVKCVCVCCMCELLCEMC